MEDDAQDRSPALSPVEISELDAAIVRAPRRTHFARAALIGVFAGLLAVAFRQALNFSESRRTVLLESLHQYPMWGWMVLPTIGGAVGCIVGWVVTRFAPETAGSGIPHLKGALLHLRTMSWRRVIPVKFFGGVAAIGAGLSLGREGPTVQMGAAVARGLAGLLRAPAADVPQLLSAGAGAGLAAAFNAPLAGLVFVVEELHRELSSRTAAGALIAAVCATVVAQWLGGDTPSFEVFGLTTLPLPQLPWAAVVGVLGGVVGVIFNKSLLGGQRIALSQKRVPYWMLPGVAGVIVGLVAWWLPDAIGGGHGVAEQVLRGATTAGAGALALLLVVKLCLTAISYASGAPGGIFAPMLLLGALCGATFTEVAKLVLPSLSEHAQVLAVLGMAAVFAGSVRAPLTGIVLVSEMTGGYELLFPICIAVLMAHLVAESLGDAPIYDALLDADLERNGNGASQAEPRTVYLSVQSCSQLAGKSIGKAKLPRGCLIISLHRSGANLLPAGDTVLLPGDHVTFLIAGNSQSTPMEIVQLCTGL
jgi:CIC family chloride channel protein